MDDEKREKRKKLIERYGQISDHGCSGCPHGSACGPLIDVELNIIERKKSRKKT